MSTDTRPVRRRSLRRDAALAVVPLLLVVGAAGICQFVLARTVHQDVRRLFEESREVALVRALVDELRGIEQWVEAAPAATGTTEPLVWTDVRQHLAAATATLARFPIVEDPSRPSHESQEVQLLRAVHAGLHGVARRLDGSEALRAAAADIAAAKRAAASLAATIEGESRTIGSELDRRSDEMTWFLLGLAAVVMATVAGVGWWLARRVLRPVHALQQAAVRLGAGELTTPIPHSQADELGDLAATLRTMAAHLRDSRAELEARVEQRSREVLRSARLAQLGTLAAGIAHEVNNPLASIVAGTEGLLREIAAATPVDREGLRDYLQILHKEALRVRDITARLLRFARQPDARREPVDLVAEAREVAALFAHQMQAANVQFELTADGDVPALPGDPAEWRQVLFNLLRNALDASPRGGVVRVVVSAHEGGVRLLVGDDGPGVPAGHEDRIFEPFFTTKDPGKGTGLGLAIVHRIVDAHGARIEVRKAEAGARGACFTITWPPPREAADRVNA